MAGSGVGRSGEDTDRSSDRAAARDLVLSVADLPGVGDSAALLDLRAGGEASGDGLHIASCAGVWMALVMGFGGLRDTGGRPAFAPRLPEHLPRLRFCLRWRASVLRVTVTPATATYEVTGPPVVFAHHGDEIEVAEGSPVTRPVPRLEERPAPPNPRPPERRLDALTDD